MGLDKVKLEENVSQHLIQIEERLCSKSRGTLGGKFLWISRDGKLLTAGLWQEKGNKHLGMAMETLFDSAAPQAQQAFLSKLIWTHHAFPPPSSFLSKAVVSVDGKPVRLQLCDTAGQDEFDKLRPLCYTNTDIFLLCFSVVSPSSFQNVSEKWVPEIRCHCPKAPIILVGTQSDLREDVKVLIELDKCKEKPVSEEAAKLCAEEIKAASYIECSALTQKNLKEVFDAAIVAGIQYSDTQQQPKKSKCRTPDKMKNLSKSWWKKYCCFV
ncbi:rho-related GTP-binding protein RhoU [Egretta garzetta]|uniref:rho-related GTP-binding protein RhoU n=1 Tax=Egretta garzetta TaxID=188379 RepID=UPI00051F1433|nr:rho-related GTP-binding protein RhoU [Egretta garzetta]